MTLKHTPATALPFHAYSGDGEGWHIGNAGQRERGEAIACTFDEGHPARAAQDAAYLAHTGSNYPLMVGALKSGQVVPHDLDRLDAETLRRFIREQADVATETLRKIDEADAAGQQTIYRRLVDMLRAAFGPLNSEVSDGGHRYLVGEQEADAIRALLRDLGEPLK